MVLSTHLVVRATSSSTSVNLKDSCLNIYDKLSYQFKLLGRIGLDNKFGLHLYPISERGVYKEDV